jgi:hypothetical protein
MFRMSESKTAVLIDGDEAEGAQSRREASDSAVMEIDHAAIDDAGGDSSLETAAAAAKVALERSEARATAATRVAIEAREREQRALTDAARANAGRQIDRAAAVAGAAGAAKSEADRAEAAYIAATENGDAPAQAKALREMTAAETRLTNATAELEAMKAWGKQEPRQEPSPGSPGPEAQRWINEHPKFHSDQEYRSIAIGAHEEALRDGINAESPAYFRHIEARLAEKYGNQEGGRNMSGSRAEPAFQGASPSRGDGRGASQSNTVQTLLGPLIVNRRANGQIGIQIPPNLRSTFQEGADSCGMTLAEYAHDHVKIADERRAGGNAGWIEPQQRRT